MPTLLNAELITDTLRSLPGWHGGPDRIWRDLQLTPEQDAELRRQVAVDAAGMDHHPLVEDVESGTRYTLWTHSAGGVTELDIVLASHISDLAHRLTGVPGIHAVRSGAPVVITRNSDAAGTETAPTMGVSSGTSDTPHVPLPDDRPVGVEPGVNPQQQL